VRHAHPDDLRAYEMLLRELRAIEGLRAPTVGSFYRRGSGFLHFHVDGTRLFADLKLDGDWERMPASSAGEQRRLLAVARRAAQA
jgi:hypothetical protein